MKNKKVLVIEDDPDTLRLFEVTLEKTGFTVQTATTGVGILKTVRSFLPDLILLDIMMPVINGYEVCEEIRSAQDVREIPIFIVSAKVFEDDVKKGIHLGANDYITKPFDPFELVERITKFFVLTDAGSGKGD